MESNKKLIEELIERATDYIKISYDVVKLKCIDKTSHIFSTLVFHSIVFVLITIFLLFINFGLAFWLGDIFGKIYYGFLLIATFYIVLLLFIQIFMSKWIKNHVYNFMINQILK